MTITTHSPIYQKAFEQYLRKGTPIEIFFKALRETPYYVWRTAGDDRVRSSHVANEGRIFAWNNPPDTGHPSEAVNCRCWAEPYNPRVTEYAYQTLVNVALDADYKWRTIDFIKHALEDGRDITLQQAGHLQDIINRYAYTLGVFARVNEQIIAAARKVGNGKATYAFSRPYDFRPVSYPHGDSTVSGFFVGQVATKENIIKVEGVVDYRFDDIFTDPIDIRELLNGTSDIARVSEAWRAASDLGGKIYNVTGQWQTEFFGQANKNAEESRY